MSLVVFDNRVCTFSDFEAEAGESFIASLAVINQLLDSIRYIFGLVR
jgi:hypothetical protein